MKLDKTSITTMLTTDEGKKLLPYKDTKGNITIGIGHNLSANGISEEICQAIFQEDVRMAIHGLAYIFSTDCLERLTNNQILGILNLVFNMGAQRFKRSFPTTIAAIERGDMETAKWKIRNSRWAKQVGEGRRDRVLKLLSDEWSYD